MQGMLITCAMIDDEPHVFDTLAHYAALSGLRVSGMYTDPDLGLEAVQKDKPDILFCDIEMPGKTGMEIAEKIPTSTLLIFVSAYEKYAVAGYAKRAVGFLRKPVKLEDFNICIEGCRQRLLEMQERTLTPGKECIILKATPGRRNLVRVWYEQIIYITIENNFLFFWLAGKEKPVKTYGNFKDLDDFMSHHGFVRVHRSRVVNKNWIDRIGYEELYLKGMAKGIKIGNSFRRDLIDALGPQLKRKR